MSNDTKEKPRLASLVVNGDMLIEKKPLALVAKSFSAHLQDVLGLTQGQMSVELHTHGEDGKVHYQRYFKEVDVFDEVKPERQLKAALATDLKIGDTPVEEFRDEMTAEETQAAEGVHMGIGPLEGGGVKAPEETPEQFAARVDKGEAPPIDTTEKRRRLTPDELAALKRGEKVPLDETSHCGQDAPEEAPRKPLYSEAPEDEKDFGTVDAPNCATKEQAEAQRRKMKKAAR